jgi:hypothetical protein
MEWDMGAQGLAALGAISLIFGVLGGLLVGDGLAQRLWTAAITTAACFGIGLVTSEGVFGWATEEDLQPNIDGLSRDEVVLSSALTTAVIVVAYRYVARRHRRPAGTHGRTFTRS